MRVGPPECIVYFTLEYFTGNALFHELLDARNFCEGGALQQIKQITRLLLN